MKQTTAAKIQTVTQEGQNIIVTYSTGTVRKYPADKIPKTVMAWMAANTEPEKPENATGAAEPVNVSMEPAERQEQPEIMVQTEQVPMEDPEPEPEELPPARISTEDPSPATMIIHHEIKPKNAAKTIEGINYPVSTQNAATGLKIAENSIPELPNQSAEGKREKIKVSPLAALKLTGLFIAGVAVYVPWWGVQLVIAMIKAAETITAAVRHGYTVSRPYFSHSVEILAKSVKAGLRSAVDVSIATYRAFKPVYKAAVDKLPGIIVKAREMAQNCRYAASRAWKFRQSCIDYRITA